MVSLTSVILSRSPYFSSTGAASENLIPLNDQGKLFHVAG